jgi:hypothetical protein
MHERFDILDFNTKRYFERTLIDLTNINEALGRLQALALTILNELDLLNRETRTGLRELALQNLTKWETDCLHPIPQQTVRACRNQFAQFAMSAWDIPLLSGLANETAISQLTQIPNREYLALKETLQLSESNQIPLDTHPANWLQGSDDFIRLFLANPSARDLAQTAGPGMEHRTELNLDNVIKKGESLDQSLRTIALTGSAGRYKLRRNLFDRLLARYRDEARLAITIAKTTSEQLARGGPNPSIGLQQPIIVDDKYGFLKKRIWFCDPKKAIVEVGHYENARYPATPLPNPGPGPENLTPMQKNLYQKTLKQQREKLEATRRADEDRNNFIINEHLRPLSPDWFTWNKTGLPLVPPALVWADRMHYEDVDVTPCWRAIRIPLFINDKDGLRVQFEFELEFFASAGVGDEARKPFLASKAILKDEIKVPHVWLDPRKDEDRVPLIWNYWVGQVCAGRFPNCTFSWPAARDAMAQKFQVTPIEKPDERWTSFEQHLKDDLEVRAKSAEQSARVQVAEQYPVEGKDMLLLVAKIGLDPNHPGVKEFIDLLIYPDTLPTLEQLAVIEARSSLPPEEILKKVDEHLALVKAGLDKLGGYDDLRPRLGESAAVLSQLRLLQAPASTYKRR